MHIFLLYKILHVQYRCSNNDKNYREKQNIEYGKIIIIIIIIWNLGHWLKIFDDFLAQEYEKLSFNTLEVMKDRI